MACEYCKKRSSKTLIAIINERSSIAWISGNKLKMFAELDSDGNGETKHVDIRYCPMCGEKLGGDAE